MPCLPLSLPSTRQQKPAGPATHPGCSPLLQEAPMSQSSNNTDDPLFIMHIGATYAVRISVLHGSHQGLMALPVQCVAVIRMQGGRGNDAQDLEVGPC